MEIKKTLFFLLLLFFNVFIGLSQYTYEFKIESNQDFHPKEVLTKITDEISYNSRSFEKDLYIINSSVNYSESDFSELLSNLSYNLTHFFKSNEDNNNEIHNKACCDITLDMVDSYGDGWNGAYLTVKIDGASTDYSASGYGSVVNVYYCDGESIEIEYTTGSYETENSYTITSPAGTLFWDGPSPQSGTVFTSTDACSSLPTPTAQDCEGAQMVCSDSSFSGNSDGRGNYNELDITNKGCLSRENQTSWYYISIGQTGSLEMSVISSNGTDDYDFAIWGPYDETTVNANCTPTENPIRCSWAAGSGPTGMGNGATDNSEGSGGDEWIAPINAVENNIYILLIDNWSVSSQPFDLNWGGTAGLDCSEVQLPVELLAFKGVKYKDINELWWSTATEKNNDFFTIEHSTDGENWKEIDQINGAGNSSSEITYNTTHRNIKPAINYYRLKQVDYNGKTTDHGIISIDNSNNKKLIKRVNMMGQEVDKNYRGVVINYYDDGSVKKVLQ